MNLTEGLPKCYAQLPDPNGPEEDRLTQPYFYLDENQKTFLLKRNWPGHEEVAKSLPCWVPQFWISSNLFGKSGGETVIQAMEKFGVYVWATQLSNVHVTFEFADVPITIGNETYPGTFFFQWFSTKINPAQCALNCKVRILAYQLSRGCVDDYLEVSLTL